MSFCVHSLISGGNNKRMMLQHNLCLMLQTAPFPNKTGKLVDNTIIENESDPNESDSDTSLASEVDDEGSLRDLDDEVPGSEDKLVPFDSPIGSGAPEKDPTVYSLLARKLLAGDINDDIPENVKVVRIFTSSTFTGDLLMGILKSSVYPLCIRHM